MKCLLTSGGVTNASIRAALEGLLGKPINESSALIVPTAQWGHPLCRPESARGSVSGIAPWGGLATLGWRSLGMLELTALPTVPAEWWHGWLSQTDALLVDGGDATYLAHHLRASGLAELSDGRTRWACRPTSWTMPRPSWWLARRARSCRKGRGTSCERSSTAVSWL